MKKTILLLFFTAILTSCSKTFYQVYTVESNGLIEKENALCYENEELKVKYNFWSEFGNLKFTVENKTDKNVFISLPKSFLVKNGLALDYFKNREFTEEATIGMSRSASKTSIWGNLLYANVSKSGNTSISTRTICKEMDIVCIPPKSYKILGEYKMEVDKIRDCDKKIEYPKSIAKVMAYDKSSSPLVLINRISYSFDSNANNCKFIENELWVSNVDNYSKKSAIRKVEIKECEGDQVITDEEFKIYSPTKYYRKYDNKPERKR